jgi:hypothetical protein
MKDSNFEPIYCTACGKLIWEGLAVGFQIRLDPEILTIEKEIIKRIQGSRTFELHRTAVSFEVGLRSLNAIQRSQGRNPIILASHSCSRTKEIFRFKGQEPGEDEIPDYWSRRKTPQLEQEGIPF